ncbi:sugar ABC transporter substrate-binding protein [Paractinoplanes abujensis]|uniref:Multiple sugar transport system substrate-binding protein n=1 Tax=Paractinoplanes abujensis TaxID=882441 RepID=A0A7W7CW13_9ACTN|nr:sugar ABC transporter substrate-binding protein [Actinoplanes abujensis]MBB4694520.1 multiple sugar transport system substrate-binding protein [Actinoplanes abujensis]GID20266.1 sugar ABC transporter substrate-binding protein [Actinoplanes abujensis]
MRRLLSGIAVAALLGSLTACGGGDDAGSDGPITLRMTTWSANPAHVQLFDAIAAEYKATHPDVTVKFDALPIDNYTTTVTTQIAGGNAPDIAWILEGSAPDFVASGALEPLDDSIENVADLAPAATALWKQDGKLMAYPFSTSPFGVFVNTDLLKKAGVTLPAEWTWENVITAAGTVAAKTGKQGLVIRDFDYKDWTNLATVFRGWDAEAWTADGKTCGFDQQPMIDAMTFLHKAIFTGKALPAPGVAADFFAGESAMTIAQISRTSLLKEGGFGWTLVPLPAGPAGEYSVIGQGGLGVLKKGKHAAAAAEFVTFFTSPANSAKLAQFFPPPRQSQLDAATLAKANPLLKPDQLQNVVIDGIADGVVKPSHTGSAELNQAVRAGLDPLWKPGADIPGVLKGVCTAINPLLAK